MHNCPWLKTCRIGVFSPLRSLIWKNNILCRPKIERCCSACLIALSSPSPPELGLHFWGIQQRPELLTNPKSHILLATFPYPAEICWMQSGIGKGEGERSSFECEHLSNQECSIAAKAPFSLWIYFKTILQASACIDDGICDIGCKAPTTEISILSLWSFSPWQALETELGKKAVRRWFQHKRQYITPM